LEKLKAGSVVTLLFSLKVLKIQARLEELPFSAE
jgi:hypothetical protein